jgi:dihydroorotase
VSLERAEWRVPDAYPFGDTTVVPMRAGGFVRWRLAA